MLAAVPIVFLFSLGVIVYYFTGFSDSPNYKAFASCPKSSQEIIEKYDIDKNKIENCQSKAFQIDSGSVDFVHLEYGDPGDCPMGCIFEHYCAIYENGIDYPFYSHPDKNLLNLEESSSSYNNSKILTGRSHELMSSSEFLQFIKEQRGQGQFRWCVNDSDLDPSCLNELHLVHYSNGMFNRIVYGSPKSDTPIRVIQITDIDFHEVPKLKILIDKLGNRWDAEWIYHLSNLTKEEFDLFVKLFTTKFVEQHGRQPSIGDHFVFTYNGTAYFMNVFERGSTYEFTLSILPMVRLNEYPSVTLTDYDLSTFPKIISGVSAVRVDAWAYDSVESSKEEVEYYKQYLKNKFSEQFQTESGYRGFFQYNKNIYYLECSPNVWSHSR